MEHVAIDLGGKESQICIRQTDGTISLETRCRTVDLPRFLEGRPQSRVIVETCAEAFHVADAAMKSGHEVRVVAASLVRSLGVGARRTKTDKRDAQILSEVSSRIDLVGVHIPSHRSREHKAMFSSRQALVTSRTKLVNTVKGWLRTWSIRLPTGIPETLPKRARATLGDKLPSHIDAALDVINVLSTRIHELDLQFEKSAKADPVCRRLMTVPGVGPITSVLFVATLDETKRFDNGSKVGAYLGLAPGENSSSERVRRTGITKAGSNVMRCVLGQAALSIKRHRRNEPIVQWALAIEKRRGKHVATVALSRKLAGACSTRSGATAMCINLRKQLSPSSRS
jgi:transposase